MDDALEARNQPIVHHLPRRLASCRNLLMKTAGNTVNKIVPRPACVSRNGTSATWSRWSASEKLSPFLVTGRVNSAEQQGGEGRPEQ
jgi:hypothetical protein